MIRKLLALVLIMSFTGCSPVVMNEQASPSLDIQISEAYAGETNAYLKGKIVFSGLSNFDFNQGNYGIQFRYFYVGNEDVLPRIDSFYEHWTACGNCEAYTWNLNEIYPVRINTKERANMLVLASVRETGSSNDMMRVWCIKKINWKQ